MTGRIAPYYWRAYPLVERTGSQIFEQLFGQVPIATLLESPYPPSPDFPQLGRYSICAGMPRQVKGEWVIATPLVGEILPFLQTCCDRMAIEPLAEGVAEGVKAEGIPTEAIAIAAGQSILSKLEGTSWTGASL